MDNRTIDYGQALNYGWASVKKDFWYFVGLAVVSGIISSIGTNHQGLNQWDVLSMLLSTWMTCGYTTIVLRYLDGKKLPFSDVFTQVKRFWEVLLASLLIGIIVMIGLILLIVPGIYLALRFQFVIQLIIDQELSVMEALKESARLTNGIKMSLLLFDLKMFGVMILGALCLGVGIFVAMPVVWLATVMVYRDIVKATPPAPVTPVSSTNK